MLERRASGKSKPSRLEHLIRLFSRINKENVSARAYIAFKTEEHVAAFSREYDGHLFQDKTGARLYVLY
jgi:hypothetical protein